jgi:hypothetical protein
MYILHCILCFQFLHLHNFYSCPKHYTMHECNGHTTILWPCASTLGFFLCNVFSTIVKIWKFLSQIQ